eukprot:superscaffoldBa00001531_g10978
MKMLHGRHRRVMYLRLREDHGQPRPLYCKMNFSVPVLDSWQVMLHSTVHLIVHTVTEEVVAIHYKVIHIPQTPEDLEAVSRGFAGLARHQAFIKTAGAINGCHVRIKPPSSPDSQCCRNRKLFPSIILQAVCDHQDRFIDMDVGWPGFDAGVWLQGHTLQK